jgi:hypothetical protein
MYLIDKLNAICATLGGTTTHKYSINALNEWCILAGGVGGHVYDIAAYNELAVIYGASGGHKYNINALNAIDVAFGGAGAWVYDVDALASIGSNVNPIPDGAIVTKDGSMIVLTTGGDYILTVDGFVPLNALKTISGDVVKTKELDFITI